MNTKTLAILGVVAVAAYLFLKPRAKATQATVNSPASNTYVASGIAAGTKIIGSLLTLAGGTPQSTTSKVGGGSGFVTSYSQIGGSDPGSSSGIITELD